MLHIYQMGDNPKHKVILTKTMFDSFNAVQSGLPLSTLGHYAYNAAATIMNGCLRVYRNVTWSDVSKPYLKKVF